MVNNTSEPFSTALSNVFQTNQKSETRATSSSKVSSTRSKSASKDDDKDKDEKDPLSLALGLDLLGKDKKKDDLPDSKTLSRSMRNAMLALGLDMK